MKVLVVEDEASLLETISRQLSRDGFQVLTSTSAEDGLKQFRIQRPDLVVLDVMLPGKSGFEFSRTIRADSKTPILFLSARASEQDRLTGFDVGGDDYLTKPFHLAELSARVRAILRRSKPTAESEPVSLHSLRIDVESHEATLGDKRLDLKPKEFSLLLFLASHPGKVFSRDALLDRVWGADAYVTPRTVDVHISWLRKQVERGPDCPRIMTVRGVGYKCV
jgi:DNA-binding response OmpR family regulator